MQFCTFSIDQEEEYIATIFSGVTKSQILCFIENLVSIKASNSLSIWATVSFSRRILSYGFKYKHKHTHTHTHTNKHTHTHTNTHTHKHTHTQSHTHTHTAYIAMLQQPEANNNQPDNQLHIQIAVSEYAYCLIVRKFCLQLSNILCSFVIYTCVYTRVY